MIVGVRQFHANLRILVIRQFVFELDSVSIIFENVADGRVSRNDVGCLVMELWIRHTTLGRMTKEKTIQFDANQSRKRLSRNVIHIFFIVFKHCMIIIKHVGTDSDFFVCSSFATKQVIEVCILRSHGLDDCQCVGEFFINCHVFTSFLIG